MTFGFSLQIAMVIVRLLTADVPVTKPTTSCKMDTAAQAQLRERLKDHFRNNPIGSPQDMSKLKKVEDLEIFLNDRRDRRYFFEINDVGFELVTGPHKEEPPKEPKLERGEKDQREEHENLEKNLKKTTEAHSRRRSEKRRARVNEAFEKFGQSTYSKTGYARNQKIMGVFGAAEELKESVITLKSNYDFITKLKETSEKVKTEAPNQGGALILMTEGPPGTWTSRIAATGRTRKETYDKYYSQDNLTGPKVVKVWAEPLSLKLEKDSNSETQNATPNILSLPKSDFENENNEGNQFPVIIP